MDTTLCIAMSNLASSTDSSRNFTKAPQEVTFLLVPQQVGVGVGVGSGGGGVDRTTDDVIYNLKYFFLEASPSIKKKNSETHFTT